MAASTFMGLPQDAEATTKPSKNRPARHQVIKAKGINSTQITPTDAVAKTLWGEARGEGTSGIDDVAGVIMNRAKGNPANLVKVVTAPKQFSVWNAGVPTVKIRNANDQRIWEYCQKVASNMVAKTFKPTHNYSYYFNPKLANPRWAMNKPYEDRGNHRFLKA
jgi:spore germination cell wall hydrolase CwlJ-like protein